jgi:crotonobetainyl-CoA:carnitine CoA-transferase CaiB-like acyl-CoA transferase
MDGMRVVEVASWLAAPSCAALLADMGADVVKIEPPGGEAFRRMLDGFLGAEAGYTHYQFDNRGKRGACVDLEQRDGQALVRRLAERADVFITNLTRPRLERYGLGESDIHAIAPSAVYAVLSGFGTRGPDSERQGFDQSAFWARSGAMSVFGDRDAGPLLCRGGYGDRITSLNLLAAILAALRVRDRTGQGQYVEVTLQRSGIWALASDVNGALHAGVQPEKASRAAPGNPIWNFYRTHDGRWLALIMPMPLAYWPKFCRLVGRDDWASDARFATLPGLAEHGPALIAEIDALFAAHDLAYWRTQLDAAGLIWEPVAELPEVIIDPALRAAGAFARIAHPRGPAIEIVGAPFHVRDADVAVRGPAPEAGEHTRAVFRQAGLDDATLDGYFARGVLA